MTKRRITIGCARHFFMEIDKVKIRTTNRLLFTGIRRFDCRMVQFSEFAYNGYEILAAILPQGCHKALRNCKITKKKYGPVAAVAWCGDDHDEPIFLVTNFLSASKACEYYSMRFTIETFFSDHKSRGFNIDRSHLSSPQRLTRLIYASCLAYLWIIFFWYLGIGDRFVQTNTPN